MLPSLDDVITLCFKLGARYRQEPSLYNLVSLRDALDEARMLANDEYDEGAALLWSFARRVKGCGKLGVSVPIALAIGSERSRGNLDVTPRREWVELAFDIAANRISYEEARKRVTRFRALIDPPGRVSGSWPDEIDDDKDASG